MTPRAAALPARVALACLACFACGGDGAGRPERVVLVTVDTLRADHLGAYGYPRDTSPFLDSLAARGAVFDRAFATSATTGPAHASLFTGLLPLAHGVRSNHQRLRADAPTLAELLGTAGYETAAFVSVNSHFPQSGLDRVFQHFDRPRGGRELAVRSAAETAAAAAAWLASREPGPLFLWVHLFDPHAPYRAPPFEQAGAASERHARYLVEQQRVDLDFFAGDPRNLLALIDLYDGEVARVDAGLRAVHAALEREAAGRRSLWIATGDHGEGLGNHGWLMHGAYIYNEQLRVPLVITDSAGALRTGRFDALVSQVDLLATLLDLTGARWPAAAGERPGASLAGLLRGGGDRTRPAVLSERRYFLPRQAGGAERPRPRTPRPFTVDALIAEAYRTGYEPGEKYALQDGRYKYVWHTLFGDELYDLAADPYEQENLAGRGLPAELRLREELLARVEALRRRAPRAAPIDAESAGALRALGYAE